MSDEIGINYEECAKTFSWAKGSALPRRLAPTAGSTSRTRRSTGMCLAGTGREARACAWMGRDGQSSATSAYAEPWARRRTVSRIVLAAARGIGKGERVFSLLGRVAGALRRRPRRAQEWQRLLAAVLRRWARARSRRG